MKINIYNVRRLEKQRSRGNDAECFIWDGLALVHRDGSDYLNEPAIGGGNPVASDGKVMFNDRLGSTVAVKGEESYSMTPMTAFGESSDSGAFFTGKPFVGELGYAFLMRSYRPENGKWQTADPMGYPDGPMVLATPMFIVSCPQFSTGRRRRRVLCGWRPWRQTTGR